MDKPVTKLMEGDFNRHRDVEGNYHLVNLYTLRYGQCDTVAAEFLEQISDHCRSRQVALLAITTANTLPR